MGPGAIAQGFVIILGGVFVIVISLVIFRSDTFIDIVTDQLMRRRPGVALDRRRLASWGRTMALVPAGFGCIVVALGIASVAVGLWG